MDKFELAIIGGGIAGISCALYAKRAGLEPVLFEKTALGGQLLYIDRIDNYPGLNLNTEGTKLLETLAASLKGLNIKVVQESLESINLEGKTIKLNLTSSIYEAKSSVIATGANFKKLKIDGEEKFSGRGVSWCAVCDGFFFKEREVAVVGGGNTAVEEAIYLSGICKKVFLIHRRKQLRALDYLQKELLRHWLFYLELE